MKICVLLVCVVCSATNSIAQAVQDITPQYTPAANIVGKWVMYSVESDERRQIAEDEVITYSETLCNVCPEIDFKLDSTGTVKSHGSDKIPIQSFYWGVRGNAIVIRKLPGKAGELSPFDSGHYRIDNRFKDMVLETVITDQKGVRHILLKSEH